MAAAAAIDFEKGMHEVAVQETASLPWDKQVINAITLTLQETLMAETYKVGYSAKGSSPFGEWENNRQLAISN